jgi:hypothetical protein
MPDPEYLLMVEVRDRVWTPVSVDRQRLLWRGVAEKAVADLGGRRCFLLVGRSRSGVLTEAGDMFAHEGAPPMGMPPGQTIWGIGELPHTVLLSLLHQARAAFTGNAPSPTPDHFPISVEAVVDVASEQYGEPDDSHEIEAAFDAAVMEFGGYRYDDPAFPEQSFYQVPMKAFGIER